MTMAATDLIKNDQAHLIHPQHHSTEAAEPLVIVEGKGAVIKDVQGNEYIDGLAGLWNVSVGHGREELARAAFEQMNKLAYYSNYVGYSNVPAVELASKIVSLSYPNMAAVYFTTAGAEANESAFKTARFYWKAKGKPNKVKVIARQNAYHGVTLQAMSATGMAPFWKMFEPRVPASTTSRRRIPTASRAPGRGRRWGRRRPGAGGGDPAGRRRHGGGVHRRADHRWGRRDRAPGRLLPAHPRDLHEARRAVHRRRGHHRVLPDGPVVRADALERPAGHPVLRQGGDVRLRPARRHRGPRDIFETMNTVKPEDRWMHAATYSGHPMCCAVGLANIGIMERERLGSARPSSGRASTRGSSGSRRSCRPSATCAGGKGLIAAVELVADRTTKAGFPADQKVGLRIRRDMEKRGLATRIRSYPVPDGTVSEQIFFSPPLVITEQQVDRVLEIVRASIKAVVPA